METAVATLPEPYYQDATCTIYNGDWHEFLPHIQADCVVTDPLYLTSNSGVPIGLTGDSGGGVATVYEQSNSVEMPWGIHWIGLMLFRVRNTGLYTLTTRCLAGCALGLIRKLFLFGGNQMLQT